LKSPDMAIRITPKMFIAYNARLLEELHFPSVVEFVVMPPGDVILIRRSIARTTGYRVSYCNRKNKSGAVTAVPRPLLKRFGNQIKPGRYIAYRSGSGVAFRLGDV